MAERGFFSISIKGLYQEGDKILAIRDEDGYWELPGGGVEEGETDFVSVLERECKEELGVDIEVIDKRPLAAWIGKTEKGYWRAVVVYRMVPKSLEYKINPEAMETRMVNKDELKNIKLVPHLRKITDFI